MTNSAEHSPLVQELLNDPAAISKLLEDYGQMSVWVLSRHVKDYKAEVDRLEKKLIETSRELADTTRRTKAMAAWLKKEFPDKQFPKTTNQETS